MYYIIQSENICDILKNAEVSVERGRRTRKKGLEFTSGKVQAWFSVLRSKVSEFTPGQVQAWIRVLRSKVSEFTLGKVQACLLPVR